MTGWLGTTVCAPPRMRANAADSANRSYEQLAREILEEAAAVDAAEDELYGEARGDELPAELADPATRRAKLKEARDRLRADWEAKQRELADWRLAMANTPRGPVARWAVRPSRGWSPTRRTDAPT